ncbi:FCD domain-containing protein [Pseudarthrobacter sp. So.54]
MESCAGTEAFLALDVRFHVALADAAGNAVVSAMMGSLREAIQDCSRQADRQPSGLGRHRGPASRRTPAHPRGHHRR